MFAYSPYFLAPMHSQSHFLFISIPPYRISFIEPGSTSLFSYFSLPASLSPSRALQPARSKVVHSQFHAALTSHLIFQCQTSGTLDSSPFISTCSLKAYQHSPVSLSSVSHQSLHQPFSLPPLFPFPLTYQSKVVHPQFPCDFSLSIFLVYLFWSIREEIKNYK
ncbi:hypothetical protein CLIB1423_08S01948 [[Candida] railenensis]|uniref:Uncharacterized protein n=1 Tax=[Candida] railenensis TaxID=45579 RepID=A0A9P0VYU1_9ASCO|nr:hypothetical protein CLIB1423_08S01948 [[Candida] railenensis]